MEQAKFPFKAFWIIGADDLALYCHKNGGA